METSAEPPLSGDVNIPSDIAHEAAPKPPGIYNEAPFLHVKFVIRPPRQN